MRQERVRNIEGGKWGGRFNAIAAGLTSMGISLWGSRILSVRGRVSGEWRSVPVNPLTFEGERFLVAPRGHTQWVRNLRAAGEGKLRLGRRETAFVAQELADEDKPPVLRAYLRRWKWETGVFFEGLTADASDAEILRVAAGYPVFRIH